MPSWIGPWEIAIVLVLALLIFGPKKLPDLGSSLGRSITGFKRGLKETSDDVQAAIKEDVTAEPAEAATASTAATASAAATVTPVATAEPAKTAASPVAPATSPITTSVEDAKTS